VTVATLDGGTDECTCATAWLNGLEPQQANK
jgi:hypothetical protein